MADTNTIVSNCKICSFPASRSHYGAISCDACKVFFRRKIEKGIMTLKCLYDDPCEVNINNRNICSACRLKKCFDVGMSPDLIRGARGKIQANVTKISGCTQTTFGKNPQSRSLSRLNLLERDQSLLTSDQWNLLSNLIHSYDEHTALSDAIAFSKKMNSAPAISHCKINPTEILEFSTVVYRQTEPFIRSNQDFVSLPANDRSIVLRNAADSVTCLGGSFILRQSGLTKNSAFRQGLENTYGMIPFNLTMTVISLLDEDCDLVKLTLSLLAFTTNSCTIFNETISSSYVKDYQAFLRIQDTYAEIIWKYLLYRYTFSQAVIRFTHLVQCFIVVLTLKTYLQSVKYHTDAIDCLVEQIEQHQLMDTEDK